MNNTLMIAAAGSGKTTYLVKRALKIKDKNILITTYTESNADEISKKFIYECGTIPDNVTVQTWFSFLLQQGVRPYQTSMHEELANERIGFFLTEKQSGFRFTMKGGVSVYWGKDNFPHYYFTKDFKIYSDKIAEFVVECNNKTGGETLNRISRIYPYIFVDEVQDLAGWELEILKFLFATKSEIILVGDPRQVTYLTHHPKKYKKYRDGKIEEFINQECNKNVCKIDASTLNKTHRNNQAICNYSSKLFPQYAPCVPCDCDSCRKDSMPNDGVFLVREEDVDAYCRSFPSIILKERLAVYPEWNFGKSKGLTFDRVLIYPTQNIINWIKNNNSSLPQITRCKFYVALTRARFSAAIVFNYEENANFPGLTKWNPLNYPN